jgi:hypothetical protein
MNGTGESRKRYLIVQTITGLAELFHRELSRAAIELYLRALLPLAELELKRAFARAVRECVHMPVPAELIRLAGVLTEKERREASAIESWGRVLHAIARWGVDMQRYAVYGEPPMFDARTDYAIRHVGGLSRINRASHTEFGFIERQFREAYEAYERFEALSEKDAKSLLSDFASQLQSGQADAAEKQ